jgi:hypothetical protein
MARTFTITQHTADDGTAPDGRHPSVSCNLCGAWAQVLPDMPAGTDVGHFDDMGTFGDGVLSDVQAFVHRALSEWSRNHAGDHSPEEHDRHAASTQQPQEVKL